MDKYCNMKKLYKEPKGKYNIFTVVFFLTSSAYKNSYEYFEGLKDNLQKFYYQFDNSFYFRLYYDKSLTEKIHNKEDEFHTKKYDTDKAEIFDEFVLALSRMNELAKYVGEN